MKKLGRFFNSYFPSSGFLLFLSIQFFLLFSPTTSKILENPFYETNLKGKDYKVECVRQQNVCFFYNQTSIQMFDLLLPGVIQSFTLPNSLKDFQILRFPQGLFALAQIEGEEVLVFSLEQDGYKESLEDDFKRFFPRWHRYNKQHRSLRKENARTQVCIFVEKKLNESSFIIFSLEMDESNFQKGGPEDSNQNIVDNIIQNKKSLKQQVVSIAQSQNQNRVLLKVEVSLTAKLIVIVDSQQDVSILSLSEEMYMFGGMRNKRKLEIQMVDYHTIFGKTKLYNSSDLAQVYFNESHMQLVLVYCIKCQSPNTAQIIINILKFSLKENKFLTMERKFLPHQLIRFDIDLEGAFFFMNNGKILFHNFMSDTFQFEQNFHHFQQGQEKIVSIFKSSIDKTITKSILTSSNEKFKLYISKCKKINQFSMAKMDCIPKWEYLPQQQRKNQFQLITKFKTLFVQKPVSFLPNDTYFYMLGIISIIICLWYLRNIHIQSNRRTNSNETEASQNTSLEINHKKNIFPPSNDHVSELSHILVNDHTSHFNHSSLYQLPFSHRTQSERQPILTDKCIQSKKIENFHQEVSEVSEVSIEGNLTLNQDNARKEMKENEIRERNNSFELTKKSKQLPFPLKKKLIQTGNQKSSGFKKTKNKNSSQNETISSSSNFHSSYQSLSSNEEQLWLKRDLQRNPNSSFTQYIPKYYSLNLTDATHPMNTTQLCQPKVLQFGQSFKSNKARRLYQLQNMTSKQTKIVEQPDEVTSDFSNSNSDDNQIFENEGKLFEQKIMEQMEDYSFKGDAVDTGAIELFQYFSQKPQQPSFLGINPEFGRKVREIQKGINLSCFDIPDFQQMTESFNFSTTFNSNAE